MDQKTPIDIGFFLDDDTEIEEQESSNDTAKDASTVEDFIPPKEEVKRYTPPQEQEQDDEEDLNAFQIIAQEYFNHNRAISNNEGWELSKEELSNIKSMDDLNELLNSIIEENSQPEYADEVVAQLDDYIRRGGKVEDFFKAYYNPDYDYNIVTVEGQKEILRDFYKSTTDFTEAKIEKLVAKFETLGDLEDEAKEAVAYLELVKQEEQKRLTVELEQRKAKEAEEYRQSVIATLDWIDRQDSLAGIELKKGQKEGLKKFVFEKQPNGKTAYENFLDENPYNELTLAFLAYSGMTKGKTPAGMKTKIAEDLFAKVKDPSFRNPKVEVSYENNGTNKSFIQGR